MAVMVVNGKNFNNDNSDEFCAKTRRHQIHLNCHYYLPSQPFLGRHLGFHISFHHSLFEGDTLFFTAWLFWIRFIYFATLLFINIDGFSLCTCLIKTLIMVVLLAANTSLYVSVRVCVCVCLCEAV